MAVNRPNPNPLGRGLRKIDAMIAAATSANSSTMRLACMVLERQIKVTLSTPGRGWIRRHRTKSVTKRGIRSVDIGRAGRHSAPGDPPAPDTGQLRNSIHANIGGHGPDGASSRVGTNLPYAPVLEFGSIAEGGFIAPRPFMRPALEAAQAEMHGVVVSDLRRITKEHAGD